MKIANMLNTLLILITKIRVYRKNKRAGTRMDYETIKSIVSLISLMLCATNIIEALNTDGDRKTHCLLWAILFYLVAK